MIKRKSIIFVEKDSFTGQRQIITCQGYESTAGTKTVSSQSNVIFSLENFGAAEAVKAGMKIANAVKGVYSTGDPRK